LKAAAKGGRTGAEGRRPAGRRVPSPAVRPAVRDERSVEFGDGKENGFGELIGGGGMGGGR